MKSDIKFKPFRVLTLDGGGMRGLYTAVVLRTLMRRFLPNSQEKDRDIGKGFDLIVGTSTGGILACALAAGKSTTEIIELYSKQGCEIFPEPMPDKPHLYIWALRNRSRPSGNVDVLRSKLTEIFQEDTILSMFKRRGIGVCIPSVNLATNKAWVFKTPHNPEKHRDDNYKISDVCRATSAAPIFLPLAAVTNPENPAVSNIFADGGLWANNPVLIGLIEALEVSGDRPIEIVSVGTSPPPSGQVVTEDNLNRGIMDWTVGIKILETSLDAQASGHQFIAGFLAKQLTSLGKSCTIIRLPQHPPSSEQIAHLGLDKASAKAVATLTQLGSSDGEMAHGWSIAADSIEKQCIKNIFTNLPILSQAAP